MIKGQQALYAHSERLCQETELGTRKESGHLSSVAAGLSGREKD